MPRQGTRTRDLLVRSKVAQNSKCCFWCGLQGNAPFISLWSWTEVGLKWVGHTAVLGKVRYKASWIVSLGHNRPV